MAIKKKSLLGNSSSQFAKPAMNTTAKAPVAGKMVSAKLTTTKLTTTKLSTTKMVVGKANLSTGRAYF